MAMENSHGKVAINIVETITMTRDKDMEPCLGLTEACTKVIG